MADSFHFFADAIEQGTAPLVVAQASLKDTWRIIFNGDGYAAEWPKEAERRGLKNVVSGVEATQALCDAKNISLFEKLGVMTSEETLARAEAMHVQYAGMVEIELRCMVGMITRSCVPACKAAGLASSVSSGLEKGVKELEKALEAMEAADSPYATAKVARVARLETMEAVRKLCDGAEKLVPPALWPIASYKELLFLDFHQGNTIGK
uniref:Glutamine synthetase C-terminal domain-containing protein n=1 Tax=Prymnesium polylepis TaxID=72548 RepID=A0A7S4K0C3_9EUKA